MGFEVLLLNLKGVERLRVMELEERYNSVCVFPKRLDLIRLWESLMRWKCFGY